jgi:hypothetical protein
MWGAAPSPSGPDHAGHSSWGLGEAKMQGGGGGLRSHVLLRNGRSPCGRGVGIRAFESVAWLWTSNVCNCPASAGWQCVGGEPCVKWDCHREGLVPQPGLYGQQTLKCV